MSRVDLGGWLLVAIALLAIAALLAAASWLLTARLGAGGEFLLPWKAARGVLFEGLDPYGTAVSAFVQEQVYGRSASPGEDPFRLVLPFHLLLLYIPFGLLRDPTIAASAWLVVSEAGFVALLYMSLFLADWQPRRSFQLILFIGAALSLYVQHAFLENSPLLLAGAVYAGILFTWRSELDELCGALIALACWRWEVGLLFLIFIVRRVVDEGRWRVLAGLGMLTGVLVAASLFVYPDWLWPFLRAVAANWRAEHGIMPAQVLDRLWPEWGRILGWGLSLLLGGVLFIEWSAARRADYRKFYWTACLTLSMTPLLGFRIQLENLVVLVLPLALILAVARERWRAGYWLAGLLLLVVLLVPWGLALGGMLPRQLRLDLVAVFLPIFCLIGLYWIRWWTVRPPRTWLERAASGEYR